MEKNIIVPNSDLRYVTDGIQGWTKVEVYPGDIPIEDLGDISVEPCRKHLIQETKWQKNVIVNSISHLISALFRNESGYSGTQYVAVGSGISDWDTDGVPDPTSSQTDLENEIGRATANVVFLDSSNNSFLTVIDCPYRVHSDQMILMAHGESGEFSEETQRHR